VEATGFPPDSREVASGWAFKQNPLTSAQRATKRSDGEFWFCTGFVRVAEIFIQAGELYKNRFFVHFL
jgi:hypothetical protein